MVRQGGLVLICLALGGCLGSPQADAPALAAAPVEAQVDLAAPGLSDAQETAMAEAIAAPKRKGLRALLRREPDRPEPDILVTEAAQNVPAVAVVDPGDGPTVMVGDAVDQAVAQAVQPDAAPRRGLLGFFRRDPVAPEAVEQVQSVSLDPAVPEAVLVPEAESAEALLPEPALEPEKRRRVLGGLFGGNREVVTEVDIPALVAEPKLETASLDPMTQNTKPEGEAVAEPTRRGLFAGRKTAPLTAPIDEVAPGTVLPFGQVGITCSVKGNALGTEIEHSPAEGRARYRLFDTQPTALGPRTFYITGFQDGCARQVTAAVVLFGDIGLYELMQYGGGAPKRGTSETDAAYRKLRGPVCRGSGQCSEQGTQTLGQRTAFLSVYETKGSSRYLEILLDDGAVLAQAMR